jgi:hypothetical protein
MPRQMSFSMTVEAVRSRSKTVTRRTGWDSLKPGDLVWAVEKSMGLKKGEKVNKLALLRVVSVEWEPLSWLLEDSHYTYYSGRNGGRYDAVAELAREGFPELHPIEFVTMFCETNNCFEDDLVNRIEFEYVDPEEVKE